MLTEIQLLFDSGLMVLIWMIQIIVYPSFRAFSAIDLHKWHTTYTQRISFLVIPLMFGQLILVLARIYFAFSYTVLAVLILILTVWAITFLQFVPLHTRIANNRYTSKTLEELVQFNWVRTVLWTLVFCADLALIIVRG